MGWVGSDKKAVLSYYSCALILLLSAWTVPCAEPQATPEARSSPAATLNVPRVQVQDLRGRRLEEAQAILSRAGLRPGTISTKPMPGIAGTVGEQSPPGNSVVRRGTTVNLVGVELRTGQNSSDGDEKFSTKVPRLHGLTPSRAISLLEHFRLQLGVVSLGNGEGVQGTIYSQKPSEGTWAKIGSKVDVQIAAPPKAAGPDRETIWVFVPNLTGQRQKAAEETLRQHFLTLGRISVESVSGAADTVFGQFPLPNTRVAEGTAVNLRIAKSAQPPRPTVAVPDLRGREVEAAKSIVEQVGLHLGQITTENSQAASNSILSQSPDPGISVERGSSVDVKTAKEIATVSVPNLVQRDQAEAIAILQKVGLQLGTVSETEGDAPTGFILSQNPREGVPVRAGTAVNVTLSRQDLARLAVMVDPANPKVGELLRFHAHLEPLKKGAMYQFTFGDGKDSGWLNSSNTTHVYQTAGDFPVEAVASSDGKAHESDQVVITVTDGPPFPWGMAALVSGLLALSAGGFRYYRWKSFRKWIRATPKLDGGVQELSVASGGHSDPCVRIRLVREAGQSEVQLGKAGHERAKTT